MPAPLHRLPFRSPASRGLTTSLSVLDPTWALELTNAVFDTRGRAAARKGWVGQDGGEGATPSGAVEAVHEYRASGSSIIIFAAGASIYSNAVTPVDQTGTLTPAANDWQFVDFNAKVIGVQQGETAISWDGGGATDFDDITAASGTTPSGNCALAAFSRLWIADSNKTTLHYSAALDETHWSTGAGTVDMLLAWPDGYDTIQALAEWQGRLVVFGTRNTVIYVNPVDPSDSAFAIDDIIPRGVVGRDAVCRVAQDLVYLSHDGLRSLQRGIQYSTLPMSELSTQIRDDLVDNLSTAIDAGSKIQIAHSPTEGGILCRIGSAYWWFDTKNPLEDGNLRASKWTGIGWNSIAVTTGGDVYLGQTAEVGLYSGYQDDGAAYLWRFRSAWFEEPEGREIIPKQCIATFVLGIAYTISMTWATDYLDNLQAAQVTLMAPSSPSEWGVAEWGLGEWSGYTSNTKRAQFPLSLSGGQLQIGFSILIDGGAAAIQQADIYAKLGATVRA